MRTSFALLACLSLVCACSSSDRGSSDSGGDRIPSSDGGSSDSGSSSCTPSDFEAQVDTICRALHPPAPEPGELGHSCTDDGQCDSNVCLEPFGSSAYCSLTCPGGDECPKGYTCQDTETALGSACYQDVCVYGGSDASDCVTNLTREIESACMESCGDRVASWLDCLEGAGLLCGPSDADEACGIERGRLESCCVACSRTSW